MQRAIVDEAFLDVTDQINEKILDDYNTLKINENGPQVDWNELGVVIGIDSNCNSNCTISWKDLQLYYAALISKEIRKCVFDELGYTCSTGIAHNKTLAKLCSGMNKPNNQVIFIYILK